MFLEIDINDRYYSSVGKLDICLNFKEPPAWISQKFFLTLFEPELLVMLGRIGEALKYCNGPL
jgi:hypothetical protein